MAFPARILFVSYSGGNAIVSQINVYNVNVNVFANGLEPDETPSNSAFHPAPARLQHSERKSAKCIIEIIFI